MLPLSLKQRESLEEATAAYQEQLADSPRSLEYLAGRGISPASVERFRLGAVVHPVDESHRRFQGMLHLPNLSGAFDRHPIGMKFRDLSPDADPKYNQPQHQVARLFNLGALNEATDTIYVTEGEFDAIILAQAGFPAIGVPGANGWKDHHFLMVDGLHVVLIVDNDANGAGDQLAQKMVHGIPDLETRTPAPFKDTNEMWLGLEQDMIEFGMWVEGIG